MDDIRILPDLVFKAIAHYNKPDCLMEKSEGTYVSIPAGDVVAKIECIAAKLIDLGIQKGDRVGLLSENRAEWLYADLGILCAGAVTVPIYGTLPPKQIEYIANDSGMKCIFVSSVSQLQKILEIKPQLPELQHVIVFDRPGDKPGDVASLSDFCASGKAVLEKDPQMVQSRSWEVHPDDVFTLVYTSGTTGEPKGVMLTHDNIVGNIRAIISFFEFNPADTTLSFLPLSHIFERMAGYYSILYGGGTIAYAENIDSIAKNLMEVRPSIFISVPRVYEKFYSRLMDNVAAQTGFKKKLTIWALKVAAQYTQLKLSRRGIPVSLRVKYALADSVVFAKIRARFGGKLRLLVAGGAALPKQLAEFFYGLGITILEGYGLTETSPVIACNRPNQFKFGTVGLPIPGVEVRIAQDGEILTRGPHVMKGYYNKPQATADAIDEQGWFHTGDIGEIDSEGFLRITDRKKDLIKTSGGKYIAPQYIENTLKTCKYVAQIVVVGDKRKFPSALIVPNWENLRKLASENQIADSEILTNPKILQEVRTELDRLSQDLAPFERVKKFAFVQKEFTIESGEMTPSLKIKRNIVEKKYKDLIDSFYAEM